MAGFSFYQSTLLMQPEIYNNEKLFNMGLNLKPFDNKGMTAFSEAVNDVYGKQFAALRGDASSKFFNTLVDFLPGISDAKGLAEGVIGFNAIGEKLAGWERGLSFLCLTELKDLVNGSKVLSKIDNISKDFENGIRIVSSSVSKKGVEKVDFLLNNLNDAKILEGKCWETMRRGFMINLENG